MLCRLTRLFVVCTIAVWCSPGHAGLWDAPPQSNADFGGSDSPTAFKTAPSSQSASTTIPASCACDANGQRYTASPAFVPAMPAYSPGSGYSQGPIYSQGPGYSQVPMQQFPVQQYAVSQIETVGPQFAPNATVYSGQAYGQAIGGGVDAMSLAQTTYSGGAVSPQWGLFRPVVSSGNTWGRAGRGRRFYTGTEYLFWYTRGQKLPALVSTSPAGTPIDEVGRIDWPATQILFGSDRLAANEHSGFRSFIGMNLDSAGRNRIEADYFDLNDQSFMYDRSTPADQAILARPFYNTFLGQEDAELVGYPGVVDGRIVVRGSTSFSGYGVALRHSLLRCGPALPAMPAYDPCGGMIGAGSLGTAYGPSAANVGYGAGGYGGGGMSPYYATGGGCGPRWKTNRLDFIAGYRNYDLEENVSIREYLTTTDPAGLIPVGTQFDIYDRFRTENRFDGADLGVDWEWTRGRLGLSVMGKTAIGNLRQRGCVDGFTTVSAPAAAPVNYNYGIMALTPNSGTFERNRLTAIPEVGFDLYYQVSCNARVRVGYSMIYLPNVIRPAGLIDTNIDPRGFPPPTAVTRFPEQQFEEEDFWAQGLRLGAEFCF